MEKYNRSLKPLLILEILGESEEGSLGITEIARRTKFSKSTVHRLINELADVGYVIRDEKSKGYSLGYRILRISSSLMNNLEVKNVALPYLKMLNKKSEETIHLVKIDGLRGVYIDKLDTFHSIGLLSRIGKDLKLHCTGAGKVLLAYESSGFLNRYYKEIGLSKFTENTITTKEELEKEMEKIRTKGYAIDRMEDKEGVCCIAAPILDRNNNLIASFSISGPSYRFTPEDAESYAPLVLDVSDKISQDLGLI